MSKEGKKNCDVYWGSHGCNLAKDHLGWHSCRCCDSECINGCVLECVSQYPYYGKDTEFYGDDAEQARVKFNSALNKLGDK